MCISAGNRGVIYTVNEEDIIVDTIGVRLMLVVHGPPKPQRRPSFRRRGGGRIQMYNPSSIEMNLMKNAIRGRLTSQAIYFRRDVPVKLSIVFFVPRPAAHFLGSRRTAEAILPEWRGEISHLGKPDLDNLIKFIMDVLNGIGYEDDNQVYKISSKKVYDNEGECRGRIGIDLKPKLIDLTI